MAEVTLIKAINDALATEMARDPSVCRPRGGRRPRRRSVPGDGGALHGDSGRSG